MTLNPGKCYLLNPSKAGISERSFKSFTKFTGKHPYRSLFLNKVPARRTANLLKRCSNTGVFLSILRNF